MWLGFDNSGSVWKDRFVYISVWYVYIPIPSYILVLSSVYTVLGTNYIISHHDPYILGFDTNSI